jgi:hypothetical protein
MYIHVMRPRTSGWKFTIIFVFDLGLYVTFLVALHMDVKTIGGAFASASTMFSSIHQLSWYPMRIVSGDVLLNAPH